MFETVNISCNIQPTNVDNPVGLELWINDQQIFNSDAVTESIQFRHSAELADNQEHVFKIHLKNKTEQHTITDDLGNITEDSTIIVENVAFDELELGQILVNQAVYEHDYNGTGSTTQDKFYRELGCNGVVTLKFHTPIYLWLLENI